MKRPSKHVGRSRDKKEKDDLEQKDTQSMLKDAKSGGFHLANMHRGPIAIDMGYMGAGHNTSHISLAANLSRPSV